MSEHDTAHDPSTAEAQTEETRACINCGADSSDRVILPAEYQGKEGWVCVRCLPFFIHGTH